MEMPDRCHEEIKYVYILLKMYFLKIKYVMMSIQLEW